MKGLHYLTFSLLAIGGLNWGLVGFFGIDLVEVIFGSGALATIVYDLVGLSALYEVFTHSKNCKVCSGKKSMKKSSDMDM